MNFIESKVLNSAPKSVSILHVPKTITLQSCDVEMPQKARLSLQLRRKVHSRRLIAPLAIVTQI